jgi:hypothetical protein
VRDGRRADVARSEMKQSGEWYDIIPDGLSPGDVMSSREDKAMMLSHHIAIRKNFCTMCFTFM